MNLLKFDWIIRTVWDQSKYFVDFLLAIIRWRRRGLLLSLSVRIYVLTYTLHLSSSHCKHPSSFVIWISLPTIIHFSEFEPLHSSNLFLVWQPQKHVQKWNSLDLDISFTSKGRSPTLLVHDGAQSNVKSKSTLSLPSVTCNGPT